MMVKRNFGFKITVSLEEKFKFDSIHTGTMFEQHDEKVTKKFYQRVPF